MSYPDQVHRGSNNIVETIWGVGRAPDAGTKKAVYVIDMAAAQIADATNYLRLSVYADFGAGPKFMKRGDEWNGHAGQVAPSLTWEFDPAHPPLLVYVVCENGTRGFDSKAVIDRGRLNFTN